MTIKGTIGTILEEFSNRTSKAGKPYAAMKAEIVLENGETARCFIFENLPEGATVELEKNEAGYWNVISKKQAAANAQQEQLDRIEKKIDALIRHFKAGAVSTTTLPPKTTVAPAPKPTSAKEAWDQYQASKDTVVDMPEGDEPPSLDDYPL